MEEISLIIKAPNQKYEDLKINCELSWTILDLKMHLFNEYPSKPTINDQRLIYSGHLLKDDQCLRDIVQSSDDSSTYTFHLVCPQRQANKSSEQFNKPSEASSSSQPEFPPEAINAFQSPNISNPMLSHFGSNNSAVMVESYNTMMNQYYQYMSYYYISSPPITDYSSYYAFANAYMRGTNINTPAFPSSNVTNENTNNNANNNNGVNDIQPNVANNRNANNNQNNNQPDNDEGNRDWTELLYSFSKAMVMLSIMYFYSSFGRLLLLITIAFVLYLYKNARLAGVQNILNNNEQDNERDQPQMEQPNDNEANNNNNPQSEQQEIPNEADNNNSENGTVPDNLRYSGLRLVWVFVSSLFTSLIPDPNPIN